MTATASEAAGNGEKSPNGSADEASEWASHVDGGAETLSLRSDIVELERLIARGTLESAENRLSHIVPETSAEAIHLEFLSALIAKKQGHPRQAIATFRAILAQYPDLQRVRIALAHTLFEVEDDEAARHHFELARGGARDQRVVHVLNQFLSALDARKRWSAMGYVSLAPSTNVNQGTTETVVVLNGLEFEVDEGSRAKSGVGLAAGGSYGFRQSIAPDVDLQLGIGADVTQFTETEYNQAQVSVSAGPRWRFDEGHAGVRAFGQIKWSGNHEIARVIGGSVYGRLRLTQSWTVSGDVGCHVLNYVSDFKGLNLSDRDGTTCDLDAKVDYAVMPSLVLSALGGVAQHRAERAERFDHDDAYYGAGLYVELPYGVTVSGDVRQLERHYREENVLLEITREDDVIDARVDLTKRDLTIFGVAPTLRYSFTRRDSTLDVYDHDTHGADLTFTRAF